MPETRDRRILVAFGAEQPEGPGHGYRIAGLDVWSARPLAELEAFRSVEVASRPPSPMIESTFDANALSPVYAGRGWVGGSEVGIECTAGDAGYRLRIDGATTVDFLLDADASVLRLAADASDTRARLAVLGPGLALALAHRDVFSLHASALEIAGTLTLVLGDSGAGKSTLAARAHATGAASRVADDLVPVSVPRDGPPVARPWFPQLKLPQRQQWRGPEEMPIGEILLLMRDTNDRAPTRTRLSTRDAVVRLIEHTVAARLFAPELRARHLDGCVRVADSIPVRRWVIPDGLDRVDEALESLISESGR